MAGRGVNHCTLVWAGRGIKLYQCNIAWTGKGINHTTIVWDDRGHNKLISVINRRLSKNEKKNPCYL